MALSLRCAGQPERCLVCLTRRITSALLWAGTRDKSSNFRSFFNCRFSAVISATPAFARFPPCGAPLRLCIVLARPALCIAFECHGRTALGYRSPMEPRICWSPTKPASRELGQQTPIIVVNSASAFVVIDRCKRVRALEHADDARASIHYCKSP
jgi:hypothetical protein